jgi:hypothetical protein
MPAAKKQFLAELMSEEARTNRLYFALAATAFLFGLVILATSGLTSRYLPDKAFASVIKIGGGFVASLGAFPLRQAAVRRQTIVIYRYFIKEYQVLDKSPNAKARHQLDQRVDRLINKKLGIE